MMNSNFNLVSWHQTLASVLDKNYDTNSLSELLRGLEQIINGSSAMFTLFSPSQPPETIQCRLLANEDPQFHIDIYNEGAFLLDPFYRKAIDEKASGVFKLKDIIPVGFKTSEYYRKFYQQGGFSDEICMLFQLEQQSIVIISIVKHANERNFSKSNVADLEATFPLLKAIVDKWLTATKTSEPNLEWRLDNALNNFGCSILTPKECKILQFILHGYAIKNIADKLSNSLETIKHHRKNIYTKLDISSQAELFYLFIASVKSMPENSMDDPLRFMK